MIWLARQTVSLPYGFTLFSNFSVPSSYHFCVSLPYGFTLFSNCGCRVCDRLPFHYLMDLHYSQTKRCFYNLCIMFHYLMDLHYSQTVRQEKLQVPLVSLPYGFTLFSNSFKVDSRTCSVSLPYGFTLFSNLA